MNTLFPSKIKSEFWIQTNHPNPPNQWTERSGKWLIFTPLNKLDEKWALISRDTESGKLGIAAKSATGKSNSLAKNSFIKVICVYTYDSADKDDVLKVRERLRFLGFINKLYYKTDQATTQGLYSSNNQSKPISLYYE